MPTIPLVDWRAVSEEIERLVLDLPGFLSCSIRCAAPRADGHTKAVLRPVTLDSAAVQLTLTGGLAAETTNHARGPARALLRGLLADAVDAHVTTTHVDLHARLTRKRHVLVSRSRPLKRAPAPAAHDREKSYPLAQIDARLLLRALGFADARDSLLPSMQAKFRQVNEFLRIVDAALPAAEDTTEPIRVVDVGCGKAYLSLATQVYLTQTRRREVHLTGVDRRDDILVASRDSAERLGLAAPQAEFVASDITAFAPLAAPDLMMSLHACDTATDEAMARGVECGAKAILCAPCCQHDVQRSLPTDGPQRALLRHGILRERLADLLADVFRAQILRILGYRVRVVEFVEPDATSRNVLIRAERGVRPGSADAVAEYLDLRNAWRVTPYLETRLSALLAPHLGDPEKGSVI